MNEIFELIARNKESMSKQQRKLADYIMENQSQVPFLNITALANLSNTSTASIVRFCKNLGYKGYPDLQNALRASVQQRLSIRERLQMQGAVYTDDDYAFIERVFHDDVNSINATLAGLDMDRFLAVMRELQSAQRIIIIAYRSALSLGTFLEYYLRLILDHVVLYPTASFMEQDELLSALDEHTVVLGITFYRYTNETIRLMEYAHRHGCVTIALTDTLQSPVVPYARYTLCAETRLPGMFETYAGPLTIINAMVSYLSKVRRDQLDRKLQSMETRWADFDVFDE